MQNVVILGSTGSIGCSTLTVIRLNRNKYNVFALTANNNGQKLLEQCLEFKPEYVVILDKDKAKWLQQELQARQLKTEVSCCEDDLSKIVAFENVDIVMSAIVGSKGLLPTYSAIKSGKKVLLANKESLIAGGKLINEALSNPTNKAKLIPVDSEHSAIFQSLPTNLQNLQYKSLVGNANECVNDAYNSINKIILTASGGPFRQFTQEQLEHITPEQATKHPNWSMGKKITVDSSTLMNKGLEVIEAHWLFGGSKLDVVVHPQSIIHSMVEYIDSSIIAQMGTPDMKTPIAYALAYPQRIESGSSKLDFTTITNLTFEAVDYTRFPCLQLAFDALEQGGAMSAVLNAANEVAVAAFLDNKISWKAIHKVVATTMEHFHGRDFNSIDEVLAIDTESRHYASNWI